MRVTRWTAVLLAGLAVGCASPVVSDSTVHIMLTNDDGIDSPGLLAVAQVLAGDPAYRVTVVAPAEQQSGVGHALVFRRNVQVISHAPLAGFSAWTVDATPASTVLLGLTALLEDDPPALVLSGINKGENLGRSAWISGTVGAAREAVMSGVPAIAFSLQLDWEKPQPDFEKAARWVKPLVDAVQNQGLPQGVLLNVNIPVDSQSARGYRLTRMDLSPYAVNRFVEVGDDKGTRLFKTVWQPSTNPDPGSDTLAISEGWVSVTPLGLDQTQDTANNAARNLAEDASQRIGGLAMFEEN
ncbi:MAG: 5'/3'-nucleotidase SurE [bacterium]|nr:5'/3'-nucleotidase SurE [bacterium]